MTKNFDTLLESVLGRLDEMMPATSEFGSGTNGISGC